jgi:hypothetical protein
VRQLRATDGKDTQCAGAAAKWLSVLGDSRVMPWRSKPFISQLCWCCRSADASEIADQHCRALTRMRRMFIPHLDDKNIVLYTGILPETSGSIGLLPPLAIAGLRQLTA